MNELGKEVREFLAAERDGMLCTLSKKMEGWPFGSIAPYALSAAGEPLILISSLAEHTKNVLADARVSLLVEDTRTQGEQQAAARATVMGYAVPVSQPFLNDAAQRYLSRFPNAAGYFETHDFSFYQIGVHRVRYIGGFGHIHWLERNEVIDETANAALDPIAPNAAGICEHMNDDHADALRLFAERFAEAPADTVRMIGIDREGFDMIARVAGAHKALRIGFDAPVSSSAEVRAAMIALVAKARNAS